MVDYDLIYLWLCLDGGRIVYYCHKDDSLYIGLFFTSNRDFDDFYAITEVNGLYFRKSIFDPDL